MMYLVETLEHFFKVFSTQVPLEAFVFLGSLAEEVISPIPSTLIMGTAGSLALLDGRSLLFLVWLSLVGNVGKMLGAWLYYVLGDKLEDVLIGKIGKFFGVTHRDIESIGQRFTGHHWKDGGTLFVLRLLPFVPTTPVSLASGIIKLDVRVFLAATYAGNFLKDLGYLYLGYAGLAALHRLWRTLEPYKLVGDVLVAVGIAGFLLFLYIHRGTGQKLLFLCGQRCRGWWHRWFNTEKE